MKGQIEKKVLTYDDLSKEFVKAKKHIGFYVEDSLGVIQVSGDKAYELINSLSLNYLYLKENNSFLLLKKGLFYFEEIYLIRLSHYKFLLFTKKTKKLMRILKWASKKYAITTINNVSNMYGLISFHGSDANEYFNTINHRHLFKTNHQNYIYYQLLFRKKETHEMIQHFQNIDISKISLETKLIFLYNNNVILYLHKLPQRVKDKVCKKLYAFKKIPKKSIADIVNIEKFEMDQQVYVSKNKGIYNMKRKRSGFITCCYFLPNKKYPFIIGIINESIKDTAYIKCNREEIFIKKIQAF